MADLDTIRSIKEALIRLDFAEKAQDLPRALMLAEELCTHDPSACANWLKLADMSARLGRRDDAAAALMQATALAQQLKHFLELARVALVNGQCGVAIEGCIEARRRFGDGRSLRRLLTEAFLRRGMLAEAKWELLRSQRIEPHDPERESMLDALPRLGEFSQRAEGSFDKRLYYGLHRGVALGGHTDDGLNVPAMADGGVITPDDAAMIIQRLIAHCYAANFRPATIMPQDWAAIPVALAMSTVTDIRVAINSPASAGRSLNVYATYPGRAERIERIPAEQASFALCFDQRWAESARQLPAPTFIGYPSLGTVEWDRNASRCAPCDRDAQMTDVAHAILRQFKRRPLDAALSSQLKWMLCRKDLRLALAEEAV